MKSRTLSYTQDASQGFKLSQVHAALSADQVNTVEARRQYYYNNVLKPEGILNPPYIQTVQSPSDRVQRALAFKERNKGLKFFIGLIQQEVIKEYKSI